jgi:hypothetical protein
LRLNKKLRESGKGLRGKPRNRENFRKQKLSKNDFA